MQPAKMHEKLLLLRNFHHGGDAAATMSSTPPAFGCFLWLFCSGTLNCRRRQSRAVGAALGRQIGEVRPPERRWRAVRVRYATPCRIDPQKGSWGLRVVGRGGPACSGGRFGALGRLPGHFPPPDVLV